MSWPDRQRRIAGGGGSELMYIQQCVCETIHGHILGTIYIGSRTNNDVQTLTLILVIYLFIFKINTEKSASMV